MKLYNTMTRKKDEFVPLVKGEAKIYACGPTVYNFIHIGNARPICVFDVLRRFLEYSGYKVTYVQNFTDIDDKIIQKANEENSDFLAVSRKYIEQYKKDAKGLNIREADFHPKATENISEIISIIETLIKKGYAYALDNGDVYFKTREFKHYGKLSHQTLDDLHSGARVRIDNAKHDPLDFALWKSAKPGEPFWESPWGKGRPGWHIECSAMARKYLGGTIDIHCGGQDLIFPHHENEIAQSECCNGVPFARYWIHNGYININSQKMSKSLGNFFTVREIAEKYGYEPIRYLMISSHYRSPINFSDEILNGCKSALERLYTFKSNLEFAIDKSSDDGVSIDVDIEKYRDKFTEVMNDDLNTADAIAVIFELVKDVNLKISNSNYSKKSLENVLSLFRELTGILGIIEDKPSESKVGSEIEDLIKKREEARKEKNWKLADEIRDELKSKNVVIEDTPQGIKITFAK